MKESARAGAESRRRCGLRRGGRAGREGRFVYFYFLVPLCMCRLIILVLLELRVGVYANKENARKGQIGAEYFGCFLACLYKSNPFCDDSSRIRGNKIVFICSYQTFAARCKTRRLFLPSSSLISEYVVDDTTGVIFSSSFPQGSLSKGF